MNRLRKRRPRLIFEIFRILPELAHEDAQGQAHDGGENRDAEVANYGRRRLLGARETDQRDAEAGEREQQAKVVKVVGGLIGTKFQSRQRQSRDQIAQHHGHADAYRDPFRAVRDVDQNYRQRPREGREREEDLVQVFAGARPGRLDGGNRRDHPSIA